MLKFRLTDATCILAFLFIFLYEYTAFSVECEFSEYNYSVYTSTLGYTVQYVVYVDIPQPNLNNIYPSVLAYTVY